MEQLGSPEESDRLYAIQDIMALEDGAKTYATSLVEYLAKENSQAVRESIVYALKMIPCDHILTTIFELFQSSDAYLRNAAVTLFGTQQIQGVAFLTSQLDHADREVRKLVLDALFQIGSQEAVLAIRAGLKDPAINVRITAVEYLGQLGDSDSIPDVLEMLAQETEPMLITSALETVLQMGDDATIHQTIQLLNKNDDIVKVHPVFLPELIKLIARSGTLERLIEIIDFVNDRTTYAKDMVMAIQVAQKRFEDIIETPDIAHGLIRMVKTKTGSDTVRYAAAELLLNHTVSESDAPVLNSKMMEALGMELLADPAMAATGIRFLHQSGSEAGRKKIETLMAETKDSSLRDLCEVLLS